MGLIKSPDIRGLLFWGPAQRDDRRSQRWDIRCKLQRNLIQASVSLAQPILRAKDAISMLGGRSAQQLDKSDEKFQEKPCSASGH